MLGWDARRLRSEIDAVREAYPAWRLPRPAAAAVGRAAEALVRSAS
jgi:hypothetical protein